jgi:hypothetical protein
MIGLALGARNLHRPNEGQTIETGCAHPKRKPMPQKRVVKRLDGAALKDHPDYRYLSELVKQESNRGSFTGQSPANAESGG